jgi:hypothetical protein
MWSCTVLRGSVESVKMDAVVEEKSQTVTASFKLYARMRCGLGGSS